MNKIARAFFGTKSLRPYAVFFIPLGSTQMPPSRTQNTSGPDHSDPPTRAQWSRQGGSGTRPGCAELCVNRGLPGEEPPTSVHAQAWGNITQIWWQKPGSMVNPQKQGCGDKMRRPGSQVMVPDYLPRPDWVCSLPSHRDPRWLWYACYHHGKHPDP